MADIEKSPLLPHDATTETGDCSESHLQQLGQQVEESRNAWIEATKAHAAAFRRTPAGRTVHRIQTIVLTLCGAFFVFVVGAMLTGVIYAIMTDDDTSYLPPRRIPLEAHIMSKCPDARDCLRDMVLPTMMEVSREVDFKLSYIGQTTEHDDGVLCKHGPEECLGNMVELCAAKLYPNPKIYLGFTMCLTRSYDQIPEHDLIHDCALEHGLSFDKLNGCLSSEDEGFGWDLLRSSVQRSAGLNVSTSCTVRLDDKTWCVRDDGQWKDCEGGSSVKDLVGEIRRLRKSHVEY